MARARVAQPGNALPGPGLRDLLWKVVVGDPREAERSLDAMNQDQSPFAQAALADPAFLALAHTLASMFVVLVPLADSARPRRVIKYAYDEPLIGVSERFAWGRIRDVLKSRLGWEPWSGWFDVPNLGSAESVHLEVAAGRDLETAGQMLGSDRRGGPISGQRRPGFAPRAHLHIDEAGPGSMGLAMVWLRARRAGLLRGAPLIGLLTAAVLTAAWFALPELAREGRNAVPLFLVVPSVLAAYLGRPGEHPFASELLLGVRVLLLGAGLLAFASAGLAAAGASAAVLRWAIGIAAVLAWVVTGLLVECWRRPRAPVTSE
jgi:hypothetical protein